MKKTGRKNIKVSAKTARVPSRARKTQGEGDELREHYDFDYSKARPNRFASKIENDAVVVTLEPDVAAVFNSSEAVNTFLRSAISAMPQRAVGKKRHIS